MVGRVTNYDKLKLEIVTDGSVEIHDALCMLLSYYMHI